MGGLVKFLKTKMKLKFYTNSEGKKQYTLKEEINSEKTKPAHYKFVKIRDAPKGPMPNHKRKFKRKISSE